VRGVFHPASIDRVLRWALWSIVLIALLCSCGPATYVDRNFGTDAGAWFVPPVPDGGAADATGG
jgi:hypothetical protein